MAALVHGMNRPTFDFSPLSIPSCCLWLDAWSSNNFTFSSGTTITSWLDRSGNGNNTTDASGSPQYTTNAGISRPGVVLNGNNYLWCTAFSNAPANNMTTFVVANMASGSAANSFIVSFGSNTGNVWATPGRNSTVGQIGIFNNSTIPNAINVTMGSPLIVAYTQTGATSTMAFTINENSSFTTTTTLPTLTRYAIGTSAVTPTTSVNRLTGAVYEVIVYTRAVTRNERLQLMAYLMWKWRNTMSTWVPAPPSTFDYFFPPYMQHARPFDPIDATNLVLWLDGSDPSTVVTDINNRVITWKDERNPAGAAAPYTEPGGSTVYRGPIYDPIDRSFFFDNNNVATKTTNQAGLRLMAFSNTAVSRNVYLTQTLSGPPNPVVAGNLACFIVFNNSRSATTTSNALIEFQNTVTPYRVIVDIGSGTGPSYVGPVLTGGATTVSFSTASNWSTSGSYSILSVLYTQSNITVRMNGTLVGTTAGSAVTLAQPTIFSIGAHIDDRTFTGYIREILCYDLMANVANVGTTAHLTASDIERVEGYLAHKWSLQSVLPNTHSFKRVPPTIAAVPTMTSQININSSHAYSSIGVYNRYGEYKWKIIGGISNGFTSSITSAATDSYGNAIIIQNSGNYQIRNQDDTIFQTFVGGNNATAITSYTPSGYARWNSKLNSNVNNTINWQATVDNSDNILIVGTNSVTTLSYTDACGTTIFTRNYTGTTSVPGYIAKYSIDGTPLWGAKTIVTGGTNWSPTCTIVVDSSNNIFTASENRGTTNYSIFNGTGTNTDTSAATFAAANTALVLAKYDPNGTVLNFTRLGPGAWLGQNANALAYAFSGTACGTGVDSAGNFFFAGSWAGTTLNAFNHPGVVTGGTLTNSGTSNGFIAKYTNSLAVSALAKIGGTSADQAWASCVDTTGNVYVAGTFTSATLTFFNAGGTPGGTLTRGTTTADGFIAKYNNNLSFVWAARISGTSTTTTAVRSLTFDKRYGTLIAGLESQAITVSFFNANSTIVSRIWTKRSPGTSYGVAITWWDPDNGALLISREHSIAGGNLIAPTQLATDSVGTLYIPQGYNNVSNQTYFYRNQ